MQHVVKFGTIATARNVLFFNRNSRGEREKYNLGCEAVADPSRTIHGVVLEYWSSTVQYKEVLELYLVVQSSIGVVLCSTL